MKNYAIFETKDMVNFLGTLASTEGIRQEVKDDCNDKIQKLIASLGTYVDEVVSANSGVDIKVVPNFNN